MKYTCGFVASCLLFNNCLIAKWLVLYNSFTHPSRLQSCLGASEVTLIGPLNRYEKKGGLRMRREYRERLPPPAQVSDPHVHHGTCVTHVPWCMPGSLLSGFLLNRWRGKRSRHSRRMRNPQFYVSGKRLMHKIVRSTTIHTKAPTACIYSWVYLLIF